MAGKKKGGGGKKEKKAKPVVDGIEINQMSRPQLYGHSKRLQDEIRKEIEERNRFMLERERYYLLWQLIMERVDSQKDKLDLMKSHMEDTMKEKDAQDAAYEQKLRFLKSEQSKKLGEVRLFHMERMKMVQDDAWNLQLLMRDSLLCKKSAIRKAQMSLFEIMRALHLKHGKDLSNMRKKFCEEIRILDSSFNRRLFTMNDKEDEVQDEVLGQIIVIKEDQLKAMVRSHEMQIKDMKMFFNELTLNNLSLIAKMELELRLSKENEIRLNRKQAALAETVHSVAGPINKANETMKEWEIMDEGLEAEVMENDLKTLLRSKARLKRQAKMMEYSNEAILQRLSIAEKERDELRKSFSHAIVDMQRKTSMKRLVTALQRKAANREAELFNAISSNLEDNTGEVDHYKLILDKRDGKLKDVMQLVTEAATDYKTTFDIYSAAYQNNVIPMEEIGFPILKSGAKPREEEDKPIMLIDVKGHKQRNRAHAPNPAEGGGGGSEGAKTNSKTSMASSQNTAEHSQPSIYKTRSATRGKSNATNSTLKTPKSSKSASQKAKAKIVDSANSHSKIARNSLAGITDKFSEHVRHRHEKEMQKHEHDRDEEEDKQNAEGENLNNRSSQLIVLKGPPAQNFH